MTVQELAGKLGCAYEGDGQRSVSAAAPLDSAHPGQLSFVANAKATEAGIGSAASCLIVPIDYPGSAEQAIIRASEPRALFAQAVAILHPPEMLHPGVHPTAAIADGVSIGPEVEIGPHVSIAEGARIGLNVRVGAGSIIGRNSSVGEGSRLHAHVTLYADVCVGRRAILHSGCVLGADGFGFVLQKTVYAKFPQVGRVEIGDDVEIGANSCVDRAALGVTSIGDGTKLDNLVHVGHNCRIGKHVVVAAQTGFSGGVVVEDYAVIGGQVGIGDKARIESRAVLGSGCGVLTSKIVRGGQVVWGTPARPLREYLEQLAHLARLPALLPALRERVRSIEKRLEGLEQR